MKKRMLALLLALAMVLSVAPAVAAAEVSGTCGENVTWVFDESTGTLTISGTGEMEYSVDLETSQKETITSVIIEEGVTSIGDWAFHACCALSSVTLPDSLISIGYHAFSHCYSLTSIDIPNSVRTIDNKAFLACNLTSVTIPASLTSINSMSFAGNNMTSITIPSSVSEMYSEAFAWCENLDTIYFTGSAPTIVFAPFVDVTATVYYPENDESWTEDIMERFAGTLTWIPYTPEPEITFTDVPKDEWYAESVAWAVENGITMGTSETTFSPDDTCKRNQVVTFLHRAMGTPEPASSSNPFGDVKEKDYFYDAVLWAVENKVTQGESAAVFGSENPCTRAHVVTFLYRAAGSPGVGNEENPFVDVSSGEYYYDAVLWAVENGITVGADASHFEPDATCTRAQIVTFLYRYMNP